MHQGLAELATSYWDTVLAANPVRATLLGDHRFDGHAPDVSPDALARERAAIAAVQERAAGIDGDALSVGERVTRALLVDQCHRRIESLDSDHIQLQSDSFLGLPVSLLRAAPQLQAAEEGHATAQLRRLDGLPTSLDQSIAHWRAGQARGWTPPRAVLTRARAAIDGYLAGSLEDDAFVSLHLPADWDGAEAWRTAAADAVRDHVRPAYARVAAALAELAAEARDDDRPGLCHLPGGDDLYAMEARHATTTDRTPEEIHAIGMRELTEVLPEQWSTVGQRALGISDRTELFARLRSDPAMRYDDAAQILALASEAVARATEVAAAWFHRMPTTGCDVAPVPESLAPSLPPAYYFPPPTDGSAPGVYYANTHEPTTRNRFEGEVFAFHEAVPGHHLELASAAELTDVPEFQRRGGYTAYSEGWGLYAERLAEEMGLYSSDEQRLGMLSADAWRSARLVLDTGLHALGWTRQQAVDFMVEHVPIDVAQVTVEVDRYLGMPGQALSYKVGQLEIRRLRARAEAGLGEGFTVADFHHRVLEHGAVPLHVLADLIETWLAGAGVQGSGT